MTFLSAINGIYSEKNKLIHLTTRIYPHIDFGPKRDGKKIAKGRMGFGRCYCMGRFLDLVTIGMEMVGVDIPNIVVAAKENLKERKKVQIGQSSIYEWSFREGNFDVYYCIGVIQHIHDSAKAMLTLAKSIKGMERYSLLFMKTESGISFCIQNIFGSHYAPNGLKSFTYFD